MNSPTKSKLLTVIFFLIGLLFIIGGYYLVITKNITLGQYERFIFIGILNIIRAILFSIISPIKNFDVFILLINIPIPFIHIGYIQMVIIFISIVGVVIRLKTPSEI